MAKIPDVTKQDGVIHKGATFYWEVTLYEDAAHTVLTELDGLTPQAVLMTAKGTKVADFVCAYIPATETEPKHIALTMSQSLTALLKADTVYLYDLDLVDADGERYRKLRGELTCAVGYAA